MTYSAGESDAPESSLKHRAMQGAVWMSIEMLGVQGTSFAVFATMAHFVAPRDFGLMSISFLAVQSLQMLVLYDISTVAVRKQRVINLDFTTAFWITTAIALVSFLALFLAAGPLQLLFHAPGLRPVLQAMSVVLLFMGLSRTHETWLIRHFQFKPLAIRGVIGAVAGGVVGVSMAIHGFGVFALVGQQIVNALVTTTLLWVVCPWRPGFKFSVATAIEITLFMRSILPNRLVYAINQNCDTLLVALVFGPVSAGFYNVGKRIRLALQLVAGEPIKNITLPALAEMQDDEIRLRRGLRDSITLVCIVCSPVFFGAAAVAHLAILVVFGQKWLNAAPVMQFLSIGGLALVLLAYNDNVFILRGRPVWCLFVALSYSALAVVAVSLCAEFHITALAVPFVLPYLIVLPLSAWLVSRCSALGLGEMLGAMLPGLVVGLVMFLVLSILAPHLESYSNILELFALCSVGGLTYFIVLVGLFPASAKILLDMLRKLKRRRLVKNNAHTQ